MSLSHSSTRFLFDWIIFSKWALTNFTKTMNEPNLDHLCNCSCKSLWVYMLLCALSDPPAYVPSSDPTSTLWNLVHDSWQSLVPAGLTSAATHATLLPPEGTKYSPFQSKGSHLMPCNPHLGYKLFFPGWLYSKISVLQLKYCATLIYREAGSGQNSCSSAILYLCYD